MIAKPMSSIPPQSLLGRRGGEQTFAVYTFTFTEILCDGKTCWEKLDGSCCPFCYRVAVAVVAVVVAVVVVVVVVVVVHLDFSLTWINKFLLDPPKMKEFEGFDTIY